VSPPVLGSLGVRLLMILLAEDPGQTYQGLLRSVRKILKEKYAQKPQLYR
jgi:hypothetical protein